MCIFKVIKALKRFPKVLTNSQSVALEGKPKLFNKSNLLSMFKRSLKITVDMVHIDSFKESFGTSVIKDSVTEGFIQTGKNLGASTHRDLSLSLCTNRYVTRILYCRIHISNFVRKTGKILLSARRDVRKQTANWTRGPRDIVLVRIYLKYFNI